MTPFRLVASELDLQLVAAESAGEFASNDRTANRHARSGAYGSHRVILDFRTTFAAGLRPAYASRLLPDVIMREIRLERQLSS